MTDTERLNFILKYMCVGDVGDDEYCPGIIIDYESLSEDLQKYNFIEWKDNLRDVIDRAIIINKKDNIGK